MKYLLYPPVIILCLIVMVLTLPLLLLSGVTGEMRRARVGHL